MKLKSFLMVIFLPGIMVLGVSFFPSKLLAAEATTTVTSSPSNLPTGNSYKSIVKIKSYGLDSDNFLTAIAEGSGIIIDQSGIVLTNYHVVTDEDEFDSSIKESSYIVCLTKVIEQEPDCSYIGKLIAGDKDLDVALLKIEKVDGYSDLAKFPSLAVNPTDATKVGDKVTAMGYPAIGGDTITITNGIISGKDSKYGIDWIKTDAIISFGSSGGAALDSAGNVIGITSSGHSDLLGSLGYVISATSINSWINMNKSKSAAGNSVTDRTISMLKKIIDTKKSDTFASAQPSYSITKPSDWDFGYDSEDGITINKESDDAGGHIAISAVKYPYLLDVDSIEGIMKRSINAAGLMSIFSIVKNEDISINGYKAKKITLSGSGVQVSSLFFPLDNYYLEIYYSYGKNDKDKAIIDNTINSIHLNYNPGSFKERTDYSNQNPAFYITGGNDWVFQANNSKSGPLFIANKQNRLYFADIDIFKTDENTKSLNNEEFLKYLLQKYKEINRFSSSEDYKVEIAKSDAHCKLNEELSDAICIDETVRSISTGEVLVQSKSYYVRNGDYYIVVSPNYFSGDTPKYAEIAKSFDGVMSTLSFVGPKALPVPSQPTIADPGKADDAGSSLIADTTSELSLDVKNAPMYARLKGKIVLRTEANGEAYYVHATTKKMYFLGRPDDAFAVMREQGVGISNANLNMIQVGTKGLSGPDADGDGLPDALEDAIGSDKAKKDSDGDGYGDKVELENGFNLKGQGKTKLDSAFSKKQAGKIFIQTEGKGEAWYVNPSDNKRYFLGRPADAFAVMRKLGLGISNKDFDSLD